jgi:ABC-type sugar transport system substrate-binding protein/predicted Ser/Thr protein kinase
MLEMLPDSLIGRRIKDYIVREKIGRGGMAVVYRAYQPSVHRDVALKIIFLGSENQDERFRERFAQEAELIARLEHLHILPIYDYGVEDDMAFIAMRLLLGGSLRELLRDDVLSIDRAGDLFNQIAAGLAYAHRRGIIHRDLKPGNILLDDVGNAFIADFGLAKMVESSLDLTDEDNIIGTPHYMAPEQIRGEPATLRSDIYSLGVLLYEMMTGELPFDSNRRSLISSIYQSLEEDPVPPHQANPNISADVEGVILRAIEKRPEKRYGSVEQMAEELNIALGRSSGLQYIPSSDEPATDITPRSMRLRAVESSATLMIPILAAMATLLIAALVALWIVNRNQEEELVVRDPVIQLRAAAPAREIVPTKEEIERARAILGEDGFVGMINCNMSSEYHATIAREIVDFAKEYGIKVEIYDPNSDAYVQVTLIEQARAEGATALILCPLDNTLLEEPLKSAQEAGIRMAFLQSDTPSYGGVRMYTDNYIMGRVPGEYAGEIVNQELDGQADVIVLGYPDIDDIVLRAQGLEDGLLAIAPNAKILGSYIGGTRELGYESVKRLLDGGTTFEVILSINDAGSYGAIMALEEAGYRGDEVSIVSVDAEILARQYIANRHFMRASVPLGRTEAARAAVDAIVKLLAGATLPENIAINPGPLVTQDTLLEATPTQPPDDS